MTRLWGGRFSGEPAVALLAFTESLSFDHVLAADDCAVLAAHARALARAKVLTDEEAGSVAEFLDAIAADIGTGAVKFEASDEDIHSVVERELLSRSPEIGPKVRAGLSRNDRVVTAVRLWLRREGRQIVDLLAVLIDTLAERAREHRETLMPGYTHLQRAQPVTVGHHLLAHAFALERDARRMLDALARADESPLGSGALAGSTLPLDATTSARDLGFADAMPNSIDAVSARDFVAEWLAASAICGVHVSRLGEEIVLWTSSEFGFAALADEHATGSSLMPQKKNPDIAELARGKAGRLVGNLTSLLVTLKGLPLAYDRDLQEDKEPLFDSVKTLALMLPALTQAVRSMVFHAAATTDAAAAPDLFATDVAEELVRRGAPFRDAHERVGEAVRTGSLPALAAELGIALDARTSVQRRAAPGPSGDSIDAQLERIAHALAKLSG
jgi:argininosuccinate lyase